MTAAKKSLRAADVMKMLEKQMTNGQPSPNPLPAAQPGVFTGTGVVRLKVMDVLAYERNPRTDTSDKYAEIKASIAARGLDQQLSVTRRPGGVQYILSRGGKTRLTILKELISEGREDLQYLDFLLTPYKGEADVLVGHLVENLARAGMTFMDTARGYMDLRAELTKERGQDIPLREFAALCKSSGLDAERVSLALYEFAITRLDQKWFSSFVSYSDVQEVLSPHRTNLDVLQKKLSAPTSKNDVDDAYQAAVSSFSRTESSAVFVASDLIDHINQSLCSLYDLKAVELAGYIRLLQADSSLDGPALQGAYQASIAVPPQTAQTTSFAGNHDGVGEQDGQDGDASDSGSIGEVDEHEDAENLASARSAVSPDSSDTPSIPSAIPSGAKIVRGDLLTPLPKKGQDQQNAGTQASGAAASPSQPPLNGLSDVETAQAQFNQALMDFANVGGVQRLVCPNENLPFQYHMEIPEAGKLGTSVEDLAVQAWWFLAVLSLQFHPEILERGFTPQAQLQLIQDSDKWNQTVEQSLGGEILASGFFMVEVLSNTASPLCGVAHELMANARDFRTSREAANAAEQEEGEAQ